MLKMMIGQYCSCIAAQARNVRKTQKRPKAIILHDIMNILTPLTVQALSVAFNNEILHNDCLPVSLNIQRLTKRLVRGCKNFVLALA